MILFIFIISQIASVKIIKVYTDTFLFPNTIIYASLLNEYGNPVISSSFEHFIYEDGKKGGKADSIRLFSDKKFLFLLLIDASKNMNDRDIRLAQMVLWNIFEETHDNIMIFLFADTLIPLINEGEKINFYLVKKRFDEIRNILRRKDAKLIDIVNFAILNFYEKVKNYPFSFVVVFSKGIDNGSKTNLQELKKLSLKTQIPVLGVGINERGNILKQISDSTYGEYIRGTNLDELRVAYDKLKFKITNSVLIFYKTKILQGDGMPHMIELIVQNAKGNRIFITPKKRIFRTEFSYIISIGIMVAVIAFFIFYNKMRTLKRKKEKSEFPIPPPIEDFVEEEKELKEEKLVKDKTQILSPYIPIEIKKYDGKENIRYKNKELITDTIIEIEYNKVIKIGSKEDNTLILPGLSPLHFTLKFEYGGFSVDAIEEIYINGEIVKGKVHYKEKGKYIINAGPYVLIILLK